MSLKGFNRNLIANPSGEHGFEGWELDRKGMIIEEGKVRCPDHPKYELTHCFATTYFWTQKAIVVDLVNEGITAEILDRYRPEIHVSEWCTHREDCGAVYELNIELLDYKGQVVDTYEFARHMAQWVDEEWEEASHVFRNYSKGVRSVRMVSRGKDTHFWAGHYGSKMAFASIVVKKPEEITECGRVGPYKRNLIQNPSGEKGFNGWQHTNGMRVEQGKVGCPDHPEFKLTHCFAAAHIYTLKSIVVDLIKEGITADVLDRHRPPIHVSEWFTHRDDCGAVYELDVKLLDEEDRVLDKFNYYKRMDQCTDPEWEKVEHTFTGYPLNARKIKMTSKGRDNHWADHYGSKMAFASIVVEYEEPYNRNLVKKSYSKILTSVNLVDEGISTSILDGERPTIVVSNSYSGEKLKSNEATYQLDVELLDENNTVLMGQSFKKLLRKSDGGGWKKQEIAFSDYPEGLRRVRMMCNGNQLFLESEKAEPSIVVKFDL